MSTTPNPYSSPATATAPVRNRDGKSVYASRRAAIGLGLVFYSNLIMMLTTLAFFATMMTIIYEYHNLKFAANILGLGRMLAALSANLGSLVCLVGQIVCLMVTRKKVPCGLLIIMAGPIMFLHLTYSLRTAISGGRPKRVAVAE